MSYKIYLEQRGYFTAKVHGKGSKLKSIGEGGFSLYELKYSNFHFNLKESRNMETKPTCYSSENLFTEPIHIYFNDNDGVSQIASMSPLYLRFGDVQFYNKSQSSNLFFSDIEGEVFFVFDRDIKEFDKEDIDKELELIEEAEIAQNIESINIPSRKIITTKNHSLSGNKFSIKKYIISNAARNGYLSKVKKSKAYSWWKKREDRDSYGFFSYIEVFLSLLLLLFISPFYLAALYFYGSIVIAIIVGILSLLEPIIAIIYYGASALDIIMFTLLVCVMAVFYHRKSHIS